MNQLPGVPFCFLEDERNERLRGMRERRHSESSTCTSIIYENNFWLIISSFGPVKHKFNRMRILFFGKKGWFPFLIAPAIFFSACGDDFLYEKNIPVESASWAYEDTLTFDFNIDDSTKIYSLLLEVSHSPDFGFQNLYVQMHTRYPSGKEDKQVLSLELASQSGVWNGKCGGKKCTLEIPLLSDVTFPETGKYSLAIEQYMRQSPLPGILGMALKIKPVGMR